MKQRRSEVFDNYAQALIDEGIIVEAEDNTEASDEKEYHKTIEMLYNVKPNGDKHILDEAHPESPVIIAPSYDRANGLVENLKERQDIMAGIALRPNHGNATQHRYASAKQDLVNELVSIGFSMDNKNEGDLMKLADSCSDRITKEAALPALLWGVAKWVGGPALLYGLIKTHVLNTTSQGTINDGVNVVRSLREAAKEADVDDKDNLIAAADATVALLRTLVAIKGMPDAKKEDGGIFDMYEENTLEDIVGAAQQHTGATEQAVQSYLAQRGQAVALLSGAQDILASKKPKQQMLPEFLADLRSMWSNVSGGSVFDKANKVINTFIESLKEENIKVKKVKDDLSQFVAQNSAALNQGVQEQSKKKV